MLTNACWDAFVSIAHPFICKTLNIKLFSFSIDLTISVLRCLLMGIFGVKWANAHFN